MYNYINGILPTTFSEYFERNRNVHQCNTRQADDLRVPFARLNVREFSIKIHGAQVWNSLPQYIKSATSINDFKKKFRNFLIDKNIFIAVTQYQCWHRGIMHFYNNCILVDCWHDNLYSHVSESMCVTEIMYSWLCVVLYWNLTWHSVFLYIWLYSTCVTILQDDLWNDFHMFLA